MKRLSLSPQVRSSVLVTLIRAAGTLIQASTLLVLARSMPPASLGWFATAWTILSINRFLGPLGLDQITLSGRIANGSPGEQATLIDASAVITIAALLTSLVLSGVSVLLVPAAEIPVVAVVGLSMPAFALCGLLTSYIRAQGNNLAAQAPESLLLPLFTLVGFCGLLALGSMTLLNALLVVLVSIWLTLLLYFAIAMSGSARVTFRCRPARLMPFVSECRSIVSAMAVTALAARSPIFLANLYLGPAAAAVMEVGNRFGTLASIIQTSTGSTYSPSLAQAHAAGDRERASHLVSTGGALAGAGALIVLLGLIVSFPFLTGPVLPTYYESSFLVMIAIGIATTINAAFGLASTYLFMSKRPEVVLGYSSAQLLCLASGSYLLAAPFGVTGISISILVATLLRDGGLMICVAKLLRR